MGGASSETSNSNLLRRKRYRARGYACRYPDTLVRNRQRPLAAEFQFSLQTDFFDTLGPPLGRAVGRSETERVFHTIAPKNIDHCLRQCDFFKITEPSQSRLSPCQLSQRESLDRYHQQFIALTGMRYLVSCILYLVSCILYLVSHISNLPSPLFWVEKSTSVRWMEVDWID